MNILAVSIAHLLEQKARFTCLRNDLLKEKKKKKTLDNMDNLTHGLPGTPKKEN
jgi:hypothetical protein